MKLRKQLVDVALNWEERFGVAPQITSAVSEYDAARLIGHTDASLASALKGHTVVHRGYDFKCKGIRYQVKANRPSGKPGSFVKLVSKAKNYEWDRLLWLLYDRKYMLQEAWEWKVEAYRAAFHAKELLRPKDMRLGKRLR